MKKNSQSFEEKLDKLRNIVEKLENDNTTIEEGLELFRGGLDITKDCLKSLKEAKIRIVEVKEEFSKLIENKINRENEELENEEEDFSI